MPTPEYHDLKEIVDRIEQKVDIMTASLRSCQARCHVDNPPRGWKRIFKSLTAFVGVLF
jgi:hypothetical protein